MPSKAFCFIIEYPSPYNGYSIDSRGAEIQFQMVLVFEVEYFERIKLYSKI